MSESYSAVRDLLERAEADAVRIRAEADRYRRQREQEAELLVAKARRLLAVAEQRAASIEAEAARQATAPRGAAPAERLSAASETDVIDFTDAAAGRGTGGHDRMLQSAIARAVDTSFHLGA